MLSSNNYYLLCACCRKSTLRLVTGNSQEGNQNVCVYYGIPELNIMQVQSKTKE